ncbi:MAG: dihydrofolate reductase family protein [Chloroflexota bacterium]|nr:dihydrofolate reductase family protein [Chloroflexota bacterium]
MGKVFLDMSMSLDGFIAGPKDDDNPDRELEALESLHDWMFSGKTEREAEEWQEAYFTTIGAIIMGRRTFDLGVGPWGDNPTFHATCFVLTKDARDKLVKQGGTTYTFVTDGIESALEKAQTAAGNKDIRVLGGANAAQQYLKAGLLDEIQIYLVPVLLGEGIRLFEHLGSEFVELERTQVIEAPGVTQLTFRVVK